MFNPNQCNTYSLPDKYMVAVGTNPDSEKLIHWTKQNALKINAEWVIVSVDLGDKLSEIRRKQLSDNLELAERLGAKIIRLIDTDVASGLLKVARENDINKIVIGKSTDKLLKRILKGGSISDKLINSDEQIDIIIINTGKQKKGKKEFKTRKIFDAKPVEYLIAFLVTAIIAAVCFPFAKTIGYQTIGLIFLMIVAVLSLFLGRTAVLFSAVLNFVVWNYFFIPPVFTFHVHSYHDVITLFANLVIAIVSGTLITRIKKNQSGLKKSQERIRILNSFLESLNNANSIKDLVRKVQDELKKHFSAEAIIYLKEKEGAGLAKKAFGNLNLISNEAYLHAKQIFENNKIIDDFNEQHNQSEIHYYPLITSHTTIGVIGILFENSSFPEPDKLTLLKSFFAQITSALEREMSIDVAKEKEVYLESQKLFQTVLNSVSHELRTPIAIISTAISNLNDDKTAENPGIRKQICEELNSASNRLNLLVENILDMSKIESGYFKLNLQDCDISDLVGIALNELKNEIHKNKINIIIQENLPTIKVDINWFKQVLINVLHNAIIYTPVGSEISIQSYLNGTESLVIELSDNGNGVPEQTLPRLFEKFFRVAGSKSGGTGLGLTIAKAIVEAHNGKIMAENRKEGGLKISIYLTISN